MINSSISAFFNTPAAASAVAVVVTTSLIKPTLLVLIGTKRHGYGSG
jgi:hypothetical protein